MYDDCIFLSLRFPQKLWKIVNECESGAIRWSLNRNTILLDYKRFQEQYLECGNSIFKTKNITSFIRQLNLYGFRKVTSHNRDPICTSLNPDVHEFLHENFRTGRPDLLTRIFRKTAGKMKHCRVNLKSIEHNFLARNNDREVSKLHMCRLALTRALRQMTQEYRLIKNKAREKDYSITNTTHSHERVPDLDLYTPSHTETSIKWIPKNSIPISPKN